jgi:hypothetical protein
LQHNAGPDPPSVIALGVRGAQSRADFEEL